MHLSLLQTKFYVPPARPNLVLRDHLIEQLAGRDRRRLTLISAPAGFGKTTLVSAWIAHTTEPVAWLSLDDDDNDPSRFFTYLIAALRTRRPEVGQAALELLAAPQTPPAKVILTLLLNDLGALSDPLTLILDDCHVITAPPLLDAISFLIDNLPPALRIVITTRIDPPLPLARWRVRNQLAEVRADDLRFTATEAAIFLNEAMGLTLGEDEIAALETRTEGWIAGLQLAALSMQGRTDVAGFVRAFSGSHRHVVSYLVEEVLNRCPTDTLDFLLQTAILDQMNAALCEAVTGRSDSQELLETLERSNLFLIPLDDVRHWYRYHHLFAEVLRARLQQTAPQLGAQLHQRASAWFVAAGQLEQAVVHALAAQDGELAADLVEPVALATILQQSEVLLARRLLERLPIASVFARPNLTLAYGITLVLSGQFEAVAALLNQPASPLKTNDLPDAIAGGMAMLNSAMARFRDQSDEALRLAQQALAQLPSDALALRAAAMLNIGAAHLQRYEREAANEALTAAVALALAGGAEYLALAAWEELATDQMRQGQLVMAKETCEQALAQVARWENQRMPAVGLLHVGLGEVLLEWNERAPAAAVLRMGVERLQGTTEIGMIVRGYSALARCQWADGDQAAAFATLQQGRQWLAESQLSLQRAHAWLAAQQARLHLWQGDLAAAQRWDQDHYPFDETALGYLQQLTRVRIRLAEYTRNPQPSFLAQATTILAPLLAAAQEKAWGSHVIEILLLQALVEHAQGQRAAAQTTIIRALDVAEPAGYLRLFVDEGEPMRLLIEDWRLQITDARRRTYVDKILSTFGEPSSANEVGIADTTSLPIRTPHAAIANLVEPLSERELEVLQLVAEGFSNGEIAARLVVATSTVKTHINHIFGKLGVQSRTQAVAQARNLGLV